jgi:hypothetical protein
VKGDKRKITKQPTYFFKKRQLSTYWKKNRTFTLNNYLRAIPTFQLTPGRNPIEIKGIQASSTHSL